MRLIFLDGPDFLNKIRKPTSNQDKKTNASQKRRYTSQAQRIYCNSRKTNKADRDKRSYHKGCHSFSANSARKKISRYITKHQYNYYGQSKLSPHVSASLFSGHYRLDELSPTLLACLEKSSLKNCWLNLIGLCWMRLLVNLNTAAVNQTASLSVT